MKVEEAKVLLGSCRPGRLEMDDPRMADALALAASDAELKKWFAEQQALDAQVAEEVQSIPVPRDLREKLLALQPAQSRSRIQRFRPALAMAAAFVVLGIAGTIWWQSQPVEFSALRQHILEQSWGPSPHLAFESRDWNQVRSWLQAQNVTEDLKIPDALQEARLHGCTVVKWHGHAVPVLCLSEGHRHMHLYVMDRTELVDVPAAGKPEFEKYGPMATASWTKADKAYVLTGFNTLSFFKKFRKAGRWVMTG
jgi:hypothetical protein